MRVQAFPTHVPAPVSSSVVRETEGDFTEASEFNRRGLFVGGCPKSGTTLLLTLLDSHPQLVVFPRETHYLDEGRKYAALGDFQAKLRHLIARSEMQSVESAWLDNSPEPGNGVTSIHSGFDFKQFTRLAEKFVNQRGMNNSLLLSETVRAYAAAMGHDWRRCVRWVEKTPSNVPYSDDLFRLFPEAKLIHILRDPRAVFASRRRLHLNRLGCYTKAHRLVREWNHSTRQIKRLEKHRGNYLVIRYEDLIQRSREVMEKICQFAGIDFLPVLLEPTHAGKEWHGNSAFYTAFTGIDSQPLDKWQEELTEDEIWWVDLHCRKGMMLAGYEPKTKARFSFARWSKRLPGESWGGYLRARKSSLCQMAGRLEDCRYD
ncbi:MAG: sulfotransferase [Pedosphaera sp.]|nr:sulfotransferase [Pedosphaera sp.]